MSVTGGVKLDARRNTRYHSKAKLQPFSPLSQTKEWPLDEDTEVFTNKMGKNNRNQSLQFSFDMSLLGMSTPDTSISADKLNIHCLY